MHCDMLKIQDGGAIVEKVNFRQICFDFAYFFPFLLNMDKHGNDHIEKYFQNLHACDALNAMMI